MEENKQTPVGAKCPITYTSRGTRSVKFNTGIVKFSRLYILKNPYVKYSVAVGLGFIMSIFSVLLVEVTGLYTGGITAMFQGFARFVYALMSKFEPHNASNMIVFNALYWGMYLLVNIPLLWFAYKKINKNFALLSATYLVTLQLVGFLWAFVPGFHDIKLFGDTFTVDPHLQDNNIQVILYSPNVFPTYNAATGSFTWQLLTEDPVDIVRSAVTNENSTKAFLLLIYAFIFACLTSVVYTVLYILGGSSAGSDIISIYYSQERNKNLGFIIFAIHSVCMSVGILLGSYFSGIVVNAHYYSGWQYLFSANFVSSFTWVMLHSIMINRIFPWKKLVRVEIFTNKLEEIRCHLRELQYIHPTTIVEAKGGYSQQKSSILMTICTCVEVPNLIQAVRRVDDKCLISTSQIVDLDGTMIVQKQTG